MIKILDKLTKIMYTKYESAGVAELADAPDLGSGVFDVQVQVLSPAPLRLKNLSSDMGH